MISVRIEKSARTKATGQNVAGRCGRMAQMDDIGRQSHCGFTQFESAPTARDVTKDPVKR
jgi:hypothetical protein